MKKVLVAPMDWGLGHAARCVPLIRELHRQDCNVMIAGSGDSLALLRKEFPRLRWFCLPAYNPRYPAGSSMALAMMSQLPHFVQVIRREHRAVEKIISDEKIDILISDNRYGCWSKRVRSVFVTHQSNILMPRRFGILQSIVRKLNERLMDRFEYRWIPDFPEGSSLAGDLIAFEEVSLRARTEYIGWLSRFEDESYDRCSSYDVVAILSGPEPQRSLLERKLLPQLKASGVKYLLVRGLPSGDPAGNDETVINFAGTEELAKYIASAELIIARSGYSTVMDLKALGSNAVFIPTPGQTEQEYLARKMMEQGVAYSMPQDRFDLSAAMRESKHYKGFSRSGKNSLLAPAVHRLLAV